MSGEEREQRGELGQEPREERDGSVGKCDSEEEGPPSREQVSALGKVGQELGMVAVVELPYEDEHGWADDAVSGHEPHPKWNVVVGGNPTEEACSAPR